MGTGLLSQGTWAIHGSQDVTSGAPKGGPSADSWIGMFPTRGLGVAPANGGVNLFDPLEGNVLYMLVQTFTNSDNIGFEVQLRRNAVSTSASIKFDPNEVARKALLLNIPYGVNEFMQYRIIKPQNFSIVRWSIFFAGKL